MAETIALAEIKSLAVRLFESLEQRGLTHAKVPNPQYWTVSLDAFQIEQPEPAVGDVWDDLRDLQGEMSRAGEEHEPILWHAFHHLSGLMQFIANADINGGLLAAEGVVQ